MINRDRLIGLYDYDMVSGLFTRKTTVSRWKKGVVAGYINADGYVVIGIDGSEYYGHRLAWLYVHGFMPDGEIDHEDRVRSNNSIENLRPASSVENKRNASLRSDNTHGKGVVLHRNRSRPFQARIGLNGKTISLGYFATAIEAQSAYAAAAMKYFNEFASPCAANDNGRTAGRAAA